MKVLLPMAPFSAGDVAVVTPPRLDQAFVNGTVDGPSGKIPRISSSLRREDHYGTIKARLGVNRMNYTVDPGLYALGEPEKNSSVLVTSNYKLSFDSLRQAMSGRNAWILVLDTLGINVWCAAGKGTFGTHELVRRITASNLKDVVTHRTLIVPQLGAPGIAAHFVKQLSGFKVHYGPVLAKDIPVYLDAGMKATPDMRRKDFPLEERLVLIPIELFDALKATIVAIPVLLIIIGLSGSEGFIENIMTDGAVPVIAIMGAVIAGAVLNPILLPYLPGRAFTTKGFTIGLLTALFLLPLLGFNVYTLKGIVTICAWFLMISAISAFLAMNFTGASTYTSLSGVRKEMKWALPLEIGTGLTGLAVWVFSRVAL
jgi:hypothetical protein